ncbi:type II secretion system F family protein [Micrococcus lylae]|uniref:type II secretion system F family protein n=1 Tax=Micrococcus lylae TaxID=1273 RepID=UPI003EB8D639
MGLLLGLLLGAGLFLVWWSCWNEPAPAEDDAPARQGRLRRMIAQAGIARLSPAGVVAAMAGCGVFALLLVLALTRALPIALCFALFGAVVPYALLSYQARRRHVLLRDVWPDAVDHVRSAIRAGLTLPEALMQLGENGPEGLREPFQEFSRDYRAGARFLDALEGLKVRMSDPVADRLVAALRMTREVGGADIGQLLQTLSEFLRQDARVRSELEARQSWTVNAARLAVAAPWVVLLLIGTQPVAVETYRTAAGAAVLLAGLVVSVVCYQLMLRIGALPQDERVIA